MTIKLKPIHAFLFLGLISLLLFTCKKDEFINPFDDPALQPPDIIDSIATANPSSIVGLHHKIFSPVCANSGCHDGAFEPDFRTIESTYNSLVYQPIVKNDTAGTYTYRVLPGDADMSVLYQRLMIDIDGQSGIMPLTAEYDSTSDWFDKKDEHIANIKAWIEDGAKDIFGNDPVQGNYLPQLGGVIAFADGSPTVLSRAPGKGAIEVPDSISSLEIWFGITDVETPTPSLTHNKVKLSLSFLNFENVPEQSLSIETPINHPGYFGDPLDYYHKITVDPTSWPLEETVFLRVYVQDGDTSIVEMPTNGSANYMKKYAAFERK